jgi:hypothetical protein
VRDAAEAKRGDCAERGDGGDGLSKRLHGLPLIVDHRLAVGKHLPATTVLCHDGNEWDTCRAGYFYRRTMVRWP